MKSPSSDNKTRYTRQTWLSVISREKFLKKYKPSKANLCKIITSEQCWRFTSIETNGWNKRISPFLYSTSCFFFLDCMSIGLVGWIGHRKNSIVFSVYNDKLLNFCENVLKNDNLKSYSLVTSKQTALLSVFFVSNRCWFVRYLSTFELFKMIINII